MSKRTVIARNDLINLSNHGVLDLGFWTNFNGTGVRLASGRNLTISLELLRQVIEALQAAFDGTDAAT